jgi:acyl dehydratase
MPTHISGLAALDGFIGHILGESDWYLVDQARIQAFADTTDDRQWIHTDMVRAASESPYGVTIAHGYLTLSLLPALSAQAFVVDGLRAKVNYGLNRVRFPAPVPAGGRLRAVFQLQSVKTIEDFKRLVEVRATVRCEGVDQPVCVADMLGLYWGAGADPIPSAFPAS